MGCGRRGFAVTGARSGRRFRVPQLARTLSLPITGILCAPRMLPGVPIVGLDPGPSNRRGGPGRRTGRPAGRVGGPGVGSLTGALQAVTTWYGTYREVWQRLVSKKAHLRDSAPYSPYIFYDMGVSPPVTGDVVV